MTESQLHESVVEWLRVALPEDAVLHHSPNETKGTVAWHAKRKRMGVRPGWPDLEIMHQGRAIFIELKAPGKYTTDSQKICHAELQLAGAVVTVCRSLEAVQAFLEQLMPLRAKVAA